jgi:ribosome biogenesis GTPase
MKLEQLGWRAYFEAAWNSKVRSGQIAARVTAQHRELWDVAGEFGEYRAHAAGRLRLAAEQGGLWPAVGDWVAVTGEAGKAMIICEVLPRRTQIVRKVAGQCVAPQVLASNVDTIFVIMGLDGDYRPRRLERYLAQIWEAGARIVVLLNKADVCENSEARAEEIRRIAFGVDVIPISAATGQGITGVDPYLEGGQTIVLLGSSGVGKSTLVNRLRETQSQATSPVRQGDSRGRHTTTARQLFFLLSGALAIDTPGLRELQLWESEAGVAQAFQDVEMLSQQCRFRNCKHAGEPGCAVTAAIDAGELPGARLEHYSKLLREQAYLERRRNKAEQEKTKNQLRVINRAVRKLYRERNREGKG